MPCIAPHNFQNHNAGMAGCGWLQPVERFSGDAHGGIEANRHFGNAQIVINGFGNADERKATLFGEARQNGEAAITANSY